MPVKLTNKVLLIFTFPAIVWAGDVGTDAVALLKKMHTTPQTLNYKGTFIYSHDGTIESMRIFHKADKDGESERLLHLNGSAREVVRNKNIVTCFLSDNKSVMVNKRQANQNILLSLPENIESLKGNYNLIVGENDRIAGRMSRTVLVQPRDNFRYGYKLWLDMETGLLLSSALLNEQKQTVERIMFTEIDFVDQIPQSLLEPTVSGKEFTWHKDMADSEHTTEAKSSWAVSSMPQGFLAAKHRIHNKDKEGPMEHIVLSDGLASVSVYVERLVNKSRKFIGSSYMGAVNVYGTVVDDHQVTVMGEVPKATVKMIASSITYKAK